MNLFVLSDAILSPCGTYRYRLERIWEPDLPLVVWIMLNPSTANATEDDPTIRRCMGYARAWGRGGIVVVNLFAYRATDPRAMRAAADPVGPENDAHLLAAVCSKPLVVAAWGNGGTYRNRGRAVHELIRGAGVPLHCLTVSKTGQPCHPLYQAASLFPVPWKGHGVDLE